MVGVAPNFLAQLPQSRRRGKVATTCHFEYEKTPPDGGNKLEVMKPDVFTVLLRKLG